MDRSRTPVRRLIAACAVIVTAVTLVEAGAASAGAKPKPPPKVTQGQVDAAAAAKNALATKVGVLGGQIAAAQAALQAAQGKQEFAEQQVALAVSQLQQARQQAATSKAKVLTAQHGVTAAHVTFVRDIQASYLNGDAVGGMTGSLLTARDPSALLNQSVIDDYVTSNRLDAVGKLQRATVARSNAEAAARRAVVQIAKRTAAAKAAKQRADDLVASTTAEQAQLQSDMATEQAELNTAQSQLATLNHDRAAYLAYKAEQARLARIRAARIRAQKLAAARAAAAAAEAAREARQHRHKHGGGGGQSSGGGGGQSSGGGGGGSAPSRGHWTPSKGRAAVRRAMSTIGTPYAWAGGGADGPSYGVCDPSNGAPNDCHVRGYDCSGLAMYAWGRNWDHFAATQYSQAGSFHPNAGQLRPGDLIFWSFNGSVSGIHHVAVYKGHGKIIEAPYSGGYVQVSPLYEYGDFFGATRPLS